MGAPGIHVSPRLLAGSIALGAPALAVGAPVVGVYRAGIPQVALDPDDGDSIVVRLVRGNGDLTRSSDVPWAVTGIGPNPLLRTDFVGGQFPSGVASFGPGEADCLVQLNFAAGQPPAVVRTGVLTLGVPDWGTIDPAHPDGTIVMPHVLPPDEDLSLWQSAWADPATDVPGAWVLWGGTAAGAVVGYAAGALRVYAGVPTTPLPVLSIAGPPAPVAPSKTATVPLSVALALSAPTVGLVSATWTLAGLAAGDLSNGRLTGSVQVAPGASGVNLVFSLSAQTLSADRAGVLTLSAPVGCTLDPSPGGYSVPVTLLANNVVVGSTGFVKAATRHDYIVGLVRPAVDILKAPAANAAGQVVLAPPRPNVTYDFRGITYHTQVDNTQPHSKIAMTRDGPPGVCVYGVKMIGGGTGTPGEYRSDGVTYGMMKAGRTQAYGRTEVFNCHNPHAGTHPWDSDAVHLMLGGGDGYIECCSLVGQMDAVNPVKMGSGPTYTQYVTSIYIADQRDDNESDVGGTHQFWRDCLLESGHSWFSCDSLSPTRTLLTARNCLICMSRLPYDHAGTDTPNAGTKFAGPYPNNTLVPPSGAPSMDFGWVTGKILKPGAKGMLIDLEDTIIRIDSEMNSGFANTGNFPPGRYVNVALVYPGPGTYGGRVQPGMAVYDQATGPRSKATGLALWNAAVDEWLAAHGCVGTHADTIRDIPFTNAD